MKLYYADGSVYQDWTTAPTSGLVIAVWRDRDGVRHLECGDDSIYFDGETFYGVNLPCPELVAAAHDLAARGLLKFGLLIPDAEYEAIWKRAISREE